MNLKEVVETAGKRMQDLVKIYHGQDHGGKGKYLEAGTHGFTRALNTMNADDFKPLAKGDDIWCSSKRCMAKTNGIEVKDACISIPYDGKKGRCYTLYFNEKPLLKTQEDAL